MNSIGSLNTALSGVQANSKAFAATAQNVANVNTDGYRPVEAVFQSQPEGGVDVRLHESQQQPPEAQSGVDLVEEATNAIAYKLGYKANLISLYQSNKMSGALLDIIG